MLLKIHNNFYQYRQETDKFLAYGKSTAPHSIGSWFNCSEDQVLFLRKAVLAGQAELCRKIPGLERRF